VLSYALFPQVAKKFFDVRDGRVAAPEAEAKPAAPAKNDGPRTLYVEDLTNGKIG